MRAVIQIELSIIDDKDADENQRWQVMHSLLNKVGLRDEFEEFKEHRTEVVSLLQEVEFDYKLFYDTNSPSFKLLTPEGKKLLESDLMKKKVRKMCDEVQKLLKDMPTERGETEGRRIVALTYVHVAGVSITDYAFLVTGSSNLTTLRLRTKTDSFKYSAEACHEVYNKLFPLTKKVHEVEMQEGAGKVKARIKVEDSIFAFETQSLNPVFVGQIIGNRFFSTLRKDNLFEMIVLVVSGLLAVLLFLGTPYFTTPVANLFANVFDTWKNTDMLYGNHKIDSTYISYIRGSLERLNTGFLVAFITISLQLLIKSWQLFWGKDIKWKLSD
jgi:hypothetical protein